MAASAVARGWHFFELDGALYAVDQRQDAAAAHLYLNGARGVATTTNTDSLTDTRQTWASGQWTNAWVKLVGGTGAGQALRMRGDCLPRQKLRGRVQPEPGQREAAGRRAVNL